MEPNETVIAGLLICTSAGLHLAWETHGMRERSVVLVAFLVLTAMALLMCGCSGDRNREEFVKKLSLDSLVAQATEDHMPRYVGGSEAGGTESAVYHRDGIWAFENDHNGPDDVVDQIAEAVIRRLRGLGAHVERVAELSENRHSGEQEGDSVNIRGRHIVYKDRKVSGLVTYRVIHGTDPAYLLIEHVELR